MINENLNSFIPVADCGSFNKAAEKLFISPTAIMKQMNQLENSLEIKLLERTNHGVKLTKAGESLYKDAQFILQYSTKAVMRARQTANSCSYLIRIGNSLLNPCKVLLDLWNIAGRDYPQFKMKIVPFQELSQLMDTAYRAIGEDFDILVGPYDTSNWSGYFQVLELGQYNFSIALSREHTLATKDRLTMADLAGERLLMVHLGSSSIIDNIYAELEHKYPNIMLYAVLNHYDIEVFNRCEQEGLLLLTLDAWQDVHPSLKTIPVDWDYKLPYGLLYPINPSNNVQRFIDIMTSFLQEQKS